MLNIWTSYHKDEIINQYNLKENDGIKLFNTANLSLKKDNINYLNKYFNEMCTLYYIWKNYIYSDYVGFQCYRYLLTYNDLSILTSKKYDVICEFGWPEKYYHLLLRSGFNDSVIYKCILFISKYLQMSVNKIIDIFINQESMVFGNTTFICSWEVFDDLCTFLFGLFDFLISNNYKSEDNIKYKVNLYKQMFNTFEELCTVNECYHPNYWAVNPFTYFRYFAYLGEWLIPIYLTIKYQGNIYITSIRKYNYQYKNLVLDLKNKDIDIKEFELWHHKNIFTGIRNIYLLNYKNTIIEKKVNEIGNYLFEYTYAHSKLCNNINDLKNLPKKDTYFCNIDEYIDVRSPFDFYENNRYTIKKL